MLCDIWQEVLEVERIGIEDDFFRLGGDSISSIRLVVSMKRNNFYVTVKDILVHRTIKHLIAFSQETHRQEMVYQPFSLVSSNIIEKIYREEIEDIYPASYLQMGMLIESSKRKDIGIYHDIFVYYVRASFGEERFLDIWQQLIYRHPMLRTSFIKNDEYGYLCIEWQDLRLEEHYQQIDNADDIDLISKEKCFMFLPEKPGLFRLLVSLTDDKEFRLVFSFHHAIMDGWSVASLIAEFVNAYVQFHPIAKTTLPSYGKVVASERATLSDEAYEDFWRAYLGDYELINARFLPNSEKADTEEQVILSDKILDKDNQLLLSLSKKLGVSPDIIFLSIYLLTAARFYSANDIVIGLLFNNRLEEDGGDKAIGLHLNMIPFRIKISPEDYIHHERFIRHVAEEKIKLESYKGYPYDKIRSLYHGQLYQLSFMYAHFRAVEPLYHEGYMRSGRSFEKSSIPLSFQANRYLDSFRYGVKGNTEFIDTETAERFLAHFKHHLEHFLKAEKNGECVYLPSADYQKQIYVWNETERPYPQGTL
ncbi:condensation domain-containing protein, partial [Legionella oakridgensis]|uniref:condensation domain-containing protein n=1 Tax=Legionella oakridgensis TaxID=29423 RepID=UPI001EE63CAF